MSGLGGIMTRIPFVLLEVLRERQRQDAKWGEQNHLNGTGPQSIPLHDIVRGPANATGDLHYAFGLSLQARSATNRHAEEGKVTWADILLEEVFEALAEDDPPRLRAELIQVAAVATQWVEAIERRERRAGS